RGCNPTSSKFIHTWLRFGEIMRGSLSAEHDLRTKDYQSQLDTLKRIEQPYIKKVMRHIPENMKFKEPEYLQTIGMNP
ncbi:hypothetical protein AB7009_24975, partial [Citrobacter werkmanii]